MSALESLILSHSFLHSLHIPDTLFLSSLNWAGLTLASRLSSTTILSAQDALSPQFLPHLANCHWPLKSQLEHPFLGEAFLHSWHRLCPSAIHSHGTLHLPVGTHITPTLLLWKLLDWLLDGEHLSTGISQSSSLVITSELSCWFSQERQGYAAETSIPKDAVV